MKANEDDEYGPAQSGGELRVPLGDMASWDEWHPLAKYRRDRKAVYINIGELSQRDLITLMYIIHKEDGNAFLGRKIREYSVQADLEERRSPRSRDRVVWTGDEILFNGERLQRRLDRLVAALEDEQPSSDVRALAQHVKEAADWADAGLSGFVRDCDHLGGMYRLRNWLAPLVAASRNLAAAVQRPGRTGPAREHGLKPVSAETLRGLAAAVREFRYRAAYEPISTGMYWEIGNPEVASLTREQRISFIRDLSARNLSYLRSRTRDLLARDEFLALHHRIMALRWRLRHATDAYHSIAQAGALSSFKDLTRRGSIGFDSHSLETDFVFIRNEDFVFFSIKAGDRPEPTHYGSTVITLDFRDIARLGGWISLNDQLFPVAGGTVHNGHVVRRGEYTDFMYRGTWKFTYYVNGIEVSNRQESSQDQVFFGADSLEGLALSVLEEADRIGGEFRRDMLETENADDLWGLIFQLFRPEAKIPSGPLINIGEESLSDDFRPMSIENPDGSALYLPDGTINTHPAKGYLPPSRPYPDYAAGGESPPDN